MLNQRSRYVSNPIIVLPIVTSSIKFNYWTFFFNTRLKRIGEKVSPIYATYIMQFLVLEGAGQVLSLVVISLLGNFSVESSQFRSFLK